MEEKKIIDRSDEPDGNIFGFIQTRIDIAALVYILGAGFMRMFFDQGFFYLVVFTSICFVYMLYILCRNYKNWERKIVIKSVILMIVIACNTLLYLIID